MEISSYDHYSFQGEHLKRMLKNSVSDLEALKVAYRKPYKYLTSGEFRPNLTKARDDALGEKSRKQSSQDGWVRAVVGKWSEMTGLPPREAEFWRDSGFLGAVKAGRNISLRRFLDDDGWAWLVISDSGGHWVHKKRLPESVRNILVKRKNTRERGFQDLVKRN